MQKLVNHSGRHSKLATPHNFQRSTGYRVNVNEVKLVHRDRPKRLFLVTAVTETGAEIQLLVSALTVTRPKLTNDLRP